MVTWRHLFVLLCAGYVALGSSLLVSVKKPEARDRVEIVRDLTTGTFRIVIEGKDVMTVNDKGLQVNGDLSFSGTMKDTQGTAPPRR